VKNSNASNKNHQAAQMNVKHPKLSNTGKATSEAAGDEVVKATRDSSVPA